MSDPQKIKEMLVAIRAELDAFEAHHTYPAIADESDLGNVVGIAIGTFSREDVENFVSGLDHGVSLSNGSHDSDEVDYLHISVRADTMEERLKNRKEIDKLNKQIQRERERKQKKNGSK